MSIKLKGSVNGSVSVDVPGTLGSDHTLTLPNGVGSAGQYLRNSGTAGTLEFGDLPAATPTAGQVIETVAGFCDGRQVTVGSGTYTLDTATQAQTISTTYVDLSGSSISYTPPSDANTLIYDFQFEVKFNNTYDPILHFKIFLDSTEITCARTSHRFSDENYQRIRAVFSLNNTIEDLANAKVGTWTSNKTIKIQTRSYSTQYTGLLHETYLWDGNLGSHFIKPTLTLTAVA